MRILLDEQLPRQLVRKLVGHNVRTVQQQSWAGLKNGLLLNTAETAGFSVLVTGDQSLEYQQNLTQRKSRWLSCLLPVMHWKTCCRWSARH